MEDNIFSTCKKCGKKFFDVAQNKMCANCEGEEGEHLTSIEEEVRRMSSSPSKRGYDKISHDVWERLGLYD